MELIAMRTKEIVGAILALTLFLGIAPIALAAAPGTPFQVGGHVYLDTAAVSGADVTVTDLTTGESLTTTTASNGAYVVALGNLPGGHSAGDTIQVTATYNGMTGTNSAPRSENLSDSPQIIDVTIVAQAVQIRAGDGTSLPTSILVDETFTVLITENGSSVGAGTSVKFTLPYGTGDPVYVSTDDDGKVNYKPPNTGTLGIEVLDGLVTVAEATVEVTESGITKRLDRVEISPDSADLLIGDTQLFSAICYATDATGGGTITGCTVTWKCDSLVIGTINSSTGLFTATGVGTATVTASATYEYVTKTDTAIVNVSAPTETVDLTDEDNFTKDIPAGTAATITVNGTFDHNVTGSIAWTPIADPEAETGSYTLTAGNDEALLGLTAVPDSVVRGELADGNDTIRIEICYNATELASKNINPGTLALWRFNDSTNEWVKMVADTPPCVANGITGNCVWIEVNNLSKFALVGTKSVPSRRGGGGGGDGSYPPGWYGTPTATPGVTPGATPGATPGVTPSKEAVTKPTTKPAVTEETPSVAEEEAAAKKKTPGFEAVFAIAGLLAGDDKRRERSLHCFLFCVRLCVRGQIQVSKKREIPPDLHSNRTL
jgi:hypothetical protein